MEHDVVRVAVGGIWHETNTFAAGRTTLSDFSGWQHDVGEEVRQRHVDVRDEIGGFLAAAAGFGWEVVPTLFAAAVPSSTVTSEAFDVLSAQLLDRLDPHLDAVLLALHGAMVVDGLDDAEAVLVEEVRRRIGAEVPVVATLDFHANVSERLYEACDVLLGYHTYPHVDPYDRAVQAAGVLAQLFASGGRPYGAFRKLPLVTAPPSQATDKPPMRDLMARVRAWEQHPDVLAVTLSGGFAFADVPWLGCSVMAHARDAMQAAAVADDVADAMWSVRAEFSVPLVSPSDAVRIARESADFPVVLVDAADNIGGGAPGDGTVLLAELIAQDAQDAVVTLVDAGAVHAAEQAGQGAALHLPLGATSDDRHGDPVTVDATVEALVDGRYVHTGSYMTGQTADMGRTAVLRVGGIQVVVSERRMMPFDAEQLRCLGIEPAQCRILVVKSAVAWRAAYGDVAKLALLVDTPGVCSTDLRTVPYQRAPKSLYPLESG